MLISFDTPTKSAPGPKSTGPWGQVSREVRRTDGGIFKTLKIDAANERIVASLCLFLYSPNEYYQDDGNTNQKQLHKDIIVKKGYGNRKGNNNQKKRFVFGFPRQRFCLFPLFQSWANPAIVQ